MTCGRWERRFRGTSAVLSGAVILVGVLAMIGWGFEVTVLEHIHPSLAAITANSAMLFVVLGIGLWLARSHGARAARARRILGVSIAIVASAVIAQYIFDIDLGIDELVFHDVRSVAHPGRMAPATALSFVLLGLALAFEDRRLTSGLARAAALLAAASALIALFGYAFGVPALYEIGPYTTVSLHSAVGFLLAASAFLMARPDEGITKLLTSDSEAGQLMRRLLPAIVLVPVVLGWLRLRGQLAGYYDTRFGLALMVLTTTIALTCFSSVIAASLRRSELRRGEAQKHLEADVDALGRLNKVASSFLPQGAPLKPVLMEVVDAAIAISGADFGNIQIVDPKSSELRIIAHRGPIVVGSPGLQSTPLVTRSGEEVGMFSTDYTSPHQPDERTLRLLDLLARQAADIIERARADERLRDSEQRFRALIAASAQIVWATDATGTLAEDSPSWREFTGQSVDQAQENAWLEAVHPDDRVRVARAWQDAVRSKSRFATEVRIHHVTGEWRWTSVSAVPMYGADGHISGWIGMNTDVTARKNAEAGRERQLREIIENAPHSVAVFDRNMSYVEASPSWIREFGMRPDPIGRNHYDLFPELPDRWKAVHRRCLAGATESSDGEPFLRKDGATMWVRWKVCPWRDLEGAIAGILIYNEDLTAQKQTSDAMRLTEDKLRLAQRVAGMGTFEWNVQTGESTWTPELEQMYGLPAGGYGKTRQAWEDLVYAEDRPIAVRTAEKAFETDVPVEGEWRVRWPDGSTHWLAARCQMFRDDAGRPLRMIGANIEITERKRTQEQLERMLEEIRDLTKNLETRVAERTKEVAFARDRLDGIISMAADAIISIDDEQRIIIFNRGAEQVFGWTNDEVLGKSVDMLWPEHLRSTHRADLARFAEETITGLRKNGETFPAEATVSKLKTDAGFQLTVILRDITERKRVEDEQARTYAERAVLLKEIHHRVKNNLQVISSLFYLQAQRTEEEPVRRLLEESRGRLQSIAIIHEKLYRSQQLASIDFGDYLRDLTASLTSAIGVQAPHVSVHVEAPDIFLDIDRAIPCALIVNELVSNSLKHGFPGGRPGEVRIRACATDSDVWLEVSDTGVGLPPDLDFRSVSTLGLQLVVSLTKQLHGTVELGAREGTSFRIQFPMTTARDSKRRVG